MNKTDIDWCDYTWNPVTGCRHGCEYCYARRVAGRFGTPYDGTDLHVLDKKVRSYEDSVRTGPYPFGFAPTFHRYRLKEPAQKAKGCNIFVCSMADLFGKWVPDWWIREVFEACKAAPQHNYLFLTKNPERYSSLADDGKLPTDKNFWFGSTVTGPDSLYWHGGGCHTFASIEPFLAPWEPVFDEANLVKKVDWVIIGAMTGPDSRQHQPRQEWVENIVNDAKVTGTPVFMKENLARVWGETLIQEFPDEIKKGGGR